MLSQICNFITWDFDPDFISSPVTIRWYGIMFVIGFIAGLSLITKMFKHEGTKSNWPDSLFIVVVICTIVVARLGHVYFYAWDYYSQHPIEILKTWEGGLASHGGAIGILIGILFYSYYVTHRNPLWTVDRLVVPVAFVAGLIRLGNLFNSEIFGHVTDLPWGFYFIRSREWQSICMEHGQMVACHPTQIYEALTYFALFGLLMFMYWKRNAGERQGLLSGVFFLVTFGARFLIEFIKNPQEAFEVGMVLNMGQWLSVPFIIAGIWLIVRAMRRQREKIEYPNCFSDKK